MCTVLQTTWWIITCIQSRTIEKVKEKKTSAKRVSIHIGAVLLSATIAKNLRVAMSLHCCNNGPDAENLSA